MNPDLIYNPLATELKNIEDTIRELKNRQRIGTDAVQTYRNKKPATWDIDWTPIFTTGQIEATRDWSIVFTSDTQAAPVNKLTPRILVDNTCEIKVASFEVHECDVAVTGYVHDSFLTYARMIPQPKKDGWYFALTAYRSGMNIKIKFYIDSTDTGTLSWTEF